MTSFEIRTIFSVQTTSQRERFIENIEKIKDLILDMDYLEINNSYKEVKK